MKQRLFVQVLLENKKDLLGGKSETEVARSKLHRFKPPPPQKKTKKLHRRFKEHVQLQSIFVSIFPK